MNAPVQQMRTVEFRPTQANVHLDGMRPGTRQEWTGMWEVKTDDGLHALADTPEGATTMIERMRAARVEKAMQRAADNLVQAAADALKPPHDFATGGPVPPNLRLLRGEGQ